MSKNTRKRGTFEPDTVVRLKKTGEFALIVRRVYLKDGKSFLHYEAEIEGRKLGALYAIYDDDVDLECLPRPRD